MRTLKILKAPAIAILLAVLGTRQAAAQSPRAVPFDHWAYEIVSRLQQRGLLLELHPTALPYTYESVRHALKEVDEDDLGRRERGWVELLEREFHPSRSKRAHAGGEIVAGLRGSTTDRLDALRAGRDQGRFRAAGFTLYPNATSRLYAEYGPFVAQAGLTFDLLYRDDPDGLEAATRLIVRNEEAYAGFGSRFFTAYLGRLKHHWGVYDEPALLVSDNPVGMDQIALRVGGERLSLRSVLGELDSMTQDGRFTGTAGADSVSGSTRRYLSSHRFDWRPSRHFSLSLMESTIYSRENAGLSLKFLNPLNVQAFSVDGRPKNDENNGILAGIIWAHYRMWTVHGQLLIDDIDLMGQTGEATSAALTGSLRYAGVSWGEFGGSITAVTARTYNTHQPEGRYVYLQRGIGTQFSDYIQLSAFASIYHARGALDIELTPKLDLLLQGESDMRLPYPGNDVDVILEGTVEETIRPAVEMRIQQGRRWWMQVDVGPSFISNEDHIRGNDRTIVTAVFSFGTRFGFRKPFVAGL